MKRFLVLFKDLEKQFKIDSQDEETAQEWAKKQLSFWKETSKVSITPILCMPEKAQSSSPA